MLQLLDVWHQDTNDGMKGTTSRMIKIHIYQNSSAIHILSWLQISLWWWWCSSHPNSTFPTITIHWRLLKNTASKPQTVPSTLLHQLPNNPQELTENKVHETYKKLHWCFKLQLWSTVLQVMPTGKREAYSQIKPLSRITANILSHSKCMKLVLSFIEVLHLIPYPRYTGKSTKCFQSSLCL